MASASEQQRDVKTTKKDATIVVTAERIDRDPWVLFAMNAHYANGGGKQDGKEKLKFDHNAGPFEMRFELEDNTKGLKLAFLPTFEEAMWVAVGTDCPVQKGDGNGAISLASPVKPSLLVVNNANSVAETLTFALRFTGLSSEGGPPYVYDPQIINGGGSHLDHS